MKDLELYNDENLMQEIKADNVYAFDILYKKYSKKLYNFSYSILKSKEESENVLQDVFFVLWEKRLTIEKGSSVRYFIFTAAHNAAITVLRKRTREIKFIEFLKSLQGVNQETLTSSIEYTELSDKLNEIIDQLPQRQKEVYLLHHEQGLKYNEIAGKLNISINTIENHMSRALKTIRMKLGAYS
jgi:RNA polymerase sigma-70 factor (ECF subfamily)